MFLSYQEKFISLLSYWCIGATSIGHLIGKQFAFQRHNHFSSSSRWFRLSSNKGAVNFHSNRRPHSPSHASYPLRLGSNILTLSSSSTETGKSRPLTVHPRTSREQKFSRRPHHSLIRLGEPCLWPHTAGCRSVRWTATARPFILFLLPPSWKLVSAVSETCE